MVKKRDTKVYELKDGKKIVGIGITKRDPCERANEHEAEGKKFTHIRTASGPMLRENAEKLEEERIKKYQKQHGGKPPKYNENKTY